MQTNALKSQPDSNTEASPSPSAERIVDAATQLFAEHGFSGASTRQIAAAAGLNIATVHHHVGTKGDLYRKVIRQLHAREAAAIEALCDRADAATTRDPEALRMLLGTIVDTFVDLSASDPVRARLYMRRWLDPDDEMRGEEADLTLTLYEKLRALIHRAQESGIVREDLNVGFFLRSVDWMIMSYFVAGGFDWESLRADPLGDEKLDEFKTYLKDYTGRMLGLH